MRSVRQRKRGRVLHPEVAEPDEAEPPLAVALVPQAAESDDAEQFDEAAAAPHSEPDVEPESGSSDVAYLYGDNGSRYRRRRQLHHGFGRPLTRAEVLERARAAKASRTSTNDTTESGAVAVVAKAWSTGVVESVQQLLTSSGAPCQTHPNVYIDFVYTAYELTSLYADLISISTIIFRCLAFV